MECAEVFPDAVEAIFGSMITGLTVNRSRKKKMDDDDDNNNNNNNNINNFYVGFGSCRCADLGIILRSTK
jgi:hypothetical protein